MRGSLAVAGLLLVAAALAPAARAQTPAEQLARAVQAYQNLEYDRAASAFRAALARTDAGGLNDSERVQALVYLAATELFAGHRDSAVVAFERALVLDPRYRIDQLTFPPEVTGLFQQVRLRTRAATVIAPRLTRLVSTGDRLSLWVYAAAFHPADVVVTRPDGAPLRTLYQGGVGDSLQVSWDGRGADGLQVASGRYLVRVDSRGSDGRVIRTVEVPLDVAQVPRDTLPLPRPLPDSVFKPEASAGGSGVGPLLTGLGGALAVVALPPLISAKAPGMGARFVVAGALGIAGAVGFPLQRRPRPLPENMAANQAMRLAWERQADSVRTENALRRRSVELVIRAGVPHPARSP